MTGLYRSEVIEARHRDWLGTIFVATPPSTPMLAVAGFAFVAAIALLLSFGQYTRCVRARGELVPVAGTANVTARSLGVLRNVFVAEGQAVEAGQPLCEISAELDSATVGETHASISEGLKAQRARFEADRADQRRLMDERQASLASTLAILQSQLSLIESQRQTQLQRVASSRDLLQRIEPLAKQGAISAFQIEERRSALLDAQAQVEALRHQALDAQRQIVSAREQIDNLPLARDSALNEIDRKLADVDRGLAQNEAMRDFVIRAPRAGIVSNLLVSKGQPVAAAQSLLTIIPDGGTLEADLWLPSSSIGSIATGNPVLLRYDAYPYQKFGQQRGHVVGVGRSALEPGPIQAAAGHSADEPLYRVRVALDDQTIPAAGGRERLRPGIALDADIVLGRRRLIESLFDSLTALSAPHNPPATNRKAPI